MKIADTSFNKTLVFLCSVSIFKPFVHSENLNFAWHCHCQDMEAFIEFLRPNAQKTSSSLRNFFSKCEENYGKPLDNFFLIIK